MELSLSKEDAGVSRRGARLRRGELSAGNACPQSRDRPEQGADAALAPDPVQEGLDRAAVAEGVWRAGLDDHAALHLRTGNVARRNAAAAGVRRHHGRSGDLHVRQRGAERRASCRASSPARSGGARATPSRARAPTSPRSRPRPSATATTTSSTARRPGPRWRSTPTGSSAWCAPIPTAKPQAGISFLLIDMKSPGITVRPIITLDGAHEVNEVFFDNVACRPRT